MSINPANVEPETAQHHRNLPNFCNLGIALRLLIIVNMLCIAAAAVKASGFNDGWKQFLGISVVAQPALIFSLMALCGLRKVFISLLYWPQVALALGLELIIGRLFFNVFSTILPDMMLMSFAQFAFFFLFTTFIVLMYFDLRARALSPALTEARLQALQARIRPHFLFNSINAVLSLIRTEPKRAERILEDMAGLFRVLMADNRNLKPLSEEIALCRQYLEIEQIRLGDRLRIVWNIEALPRDALVPPLFLQPLIENAVYHGIEPSPDEAELMIAVRPQGKQVIIELTNPYHAESTHVSGNRMALNNIKERLQLHFDAEASLSAVAEQGRYTVTIKMPNLDKEP